MTCVGKAAHGSSSRRRSSGCRSTFSGLVHGGDAVAMVEPDDECWAQVLVA